MSVAVVLATLLLHPVLDESTELRLVGTGAEIEWTVDGVVIGTTADREPLQILVGPGRHTIEASGPGDVAWKVLARPDSSDGAGARYVQGWTAAHTPQAGYAGPESSLPGWPVWALGAAGLALVLVPRNKPRDDNEAGK